MDSSIKVALITGGASGLGRHISQAFLEQGYKVAINYLSSEENAWDLIARAGDRAIAIKADVGDSVQARSMIERIEQRFGRLDLLINNAGITKDSLLIRQTEADWDTVIRTNLTGCFNLIRAAAPLMIRSGGGHVINISSYSGIKGKAGQAAYSASKAGLIGLTISAAHELAEHNIRVNAVVPGYMRTEMGATAEEAMDRAKEESILKTLSEPSEVARSLVSIAGMDYITGQILSLDSRIL
ncbi:MAG: SDR family NAD(P)-dependent oxidoreductase [Nitrospirae bacterium]|nr:SDR family NAD(P)-dependent oxidoreductase [Nitrospirota bacterium]